MKSQPPERILWTQPSSENYDESNLSQRNRQGNVGKMSRLVEGTLRIKNKRILQEKKRNRVRFEEQMRKEMESELDSAAVVIQKHARGYIARKEFVKKLIQKYERENYLLQVEREIKEFWEKDEKVKHMAAYRIQRYWKGFRKHPLQIGLIKRIVRMVIVEREFISLLERRRKKKKEAAVDYICKSYREQILRLYWKELTNYDPIVESVENEDKEEIEDIEIIEKIEESPRISLALPKENEELPDTVSTTSRVPTGIRHKVSMLSEISLIKPVLSSKYKKSDNVPESRAISVPTIPKGPRSRAVIQRRLFKQKKTRISDLSDLSKDSCKKRENPTVRVSSEARLVNNQIIPRKCDKIESKTKQFRIKTAVRSSSYIPGRKLLEEKEKDEIINTCNHKILLPTLEFKQALPELYEFIESYRPLQKKSDPLVSDSRLILISSLKSILQR